MKDRWNAANFGRRADMLRRARWFESVTHWASQLWDSLPEGARTALQNLYHVEEELVQP